MPMHNLLDYSKKCKKTVGSLYNYYRDELSGDANNDNFGNIKVVNSKAFKYKNKIIGNTYNVAAADSNYDRNKEGTQKNGISYTTEIFRQLLESIKHAIN